MPSNIILRIFVKLLSSSITVFLILDIISSFIGIFVLIPKSNIFFKIIIAASLSSFAIVSNGCGKIIREILRNGFHVMIGKREIEVSSRYVFLISCVLPSIFAVWDWFTSYLGYCILFSGLAFNKTNDIYHLVNWHYSQFDQNILIATCVILSCILTSCSPYITLRLAEIQHTVGYKGLKKNFDAEEELENIHDTNFSRKAI